MSVGIWNCTFYLVDDEGEYIRNKDGSVRLYDSNNKIDYSTWSEYLTEEDLIPLPSRRTQYDEVESPEDYQHHTSNINYRSS